MSRRLSKEPWLAVNLSFVAPGIGQFYAGKRGLGTLFLLGGVLIFLGVQWAFFSPRGSLLLAGMLVPALLAFWIFNLFNAYFCAKRANSSPDEQFRKQVRDPYLAAFLTQIAPGIGHLYLRRWVAGVLLIIVTLAMWLAPVRFVQLIFVIFTPVYTAGVCGLAYAAAPPARRQHKRGIVWLCVLIVGTGMMLRGSVLLIRQYALEAFLVPKPSMAPTIESGDRILVWKGSSYRPERGDVVAFRSPKNRNVIYIKRVAALEGETIELKDGGVFVNGLRLTGGAFSRFQFFSTLYQEFAKEGEAFVIPPGCLFLLGDNSLRSLDSRHFGAVPVRDVIGKAYKRYWPLSRAGPVE